MSEVEKKKKISIGICCYNEEDNISLMYEAVTKEMKQIDNYDYEIIFSDNSSTDSSQSILKEIAEKDEKVKVIINQTNFGAERSGINCYYNASGDAYIGLACDFQDPPDFIPEFIREWEKGYDIVWGQKIKSKEDPIKYLCRSFFYKIIKVLSDHPQYEQVTGYGLVDKKVLDILYITQRQDPEYTMRNLACEYGFKTKLIPYTQRARERGKSKYGLYDYFHFAITSLVNTSTKPLHILTVVGFAVSVLCILVALFYFVYKITHWDSFDVGMAPMLIGLFMVSGIQMFCIGILGEYISVILRRVTDKPVVVEREKINFSSDES